MKYEITPAIPGSSSELREKLDPSTSLRVNFFSPTRGVSVPAASRREAGLSPVCTEFQIHPSSFTLHTSLVKVHTIIGLLIHFSSKGRTQT